MQYVPITIIVASSNPFHGEVYSIQHYMIKSVSDLRNLSVFALVLWFPAPIMLSVALFNITIVIPFDNST